MLRSLVCTCIFGLFAFGNFERQSAWAWQSADSFTVLVYNVENLFDADNVALFDDYKPDRYQPKDLVKKLKNITQVLANFNGGKGPEVILFQEFESDQTPGKTPFDYSAFLKSYSGTTVDAMLGKNINDTIRDLPVEALLLKSLTDAGLRPYNVSLGEYRPDPTGRIVAHINATFSQFPIVSTTTHQTEGARGILEVVHKVGGSQLITMNNHWKSGASNVDDEKIRLGNASTLRERVDQLLKSDPSADIVIGGDFNSQYNQAVVNSKMEQTAINGIAGSQGDEQAIQKPGGPSLYNLWHEVPVKQRGSDVYNERWGTLMQMMITRGLYDFSGTQYVDNSFTTAAVPNINAQAGSLVPISWESIDGMSGGFSDHLPVYANFKLVREGDKKRFMELSNPGKNDSPKELRAVDYAATAQAEPLRSIRELGTDAAIKSTDNLGHAFLVDATVSGDFPFRVKIFDEEYTVWAYNEKFRVDMYKRFPVGKPMKFLGEVGIHKGKWQFIVRDPSWLEVR
jgi:endonuclease/exonuclease/phosphatase family metal-dependent hydrolase